MTQQLDPAALNAAFAERLVWACNNAGVPPLHYGRLRWVRDQMQRRFNEQVTDEGVRKWFSGKVFPRRGKLIMLAAILGVDLDWLSNGPGAAFVEEKAVPFRHAKPPVEGDRGRFILDRIREKLGGTVTIMPGLDLTEPTGEVWDAERD